VFGGKGADNPISLKIVDLGKRQDLLCRMSTKRETEEEEEKERRM